MAFDTDRYGTTTARFYDAMYAVHRDPVGDATFYLDLACETGGAVLELGCGTGRVLLPIAQAGIACTGVDVSPAMLARLRQKVRRRRSAWWRRPCRSSTSRRRPFV